MTCTCLSDPIAKQIHLKLSEFCEPSVIIHILGPKCFFVISDSFNLSVCHNLQTALDSWCPLYIIPSSRHLGHPSHERGKAQQSPHSSIAVTNTIRWLGLGQLTEASLIEAR